MDTKKISKGQEVVNILVNQRGGESYFRGSWRDLDADKYLVWDGKTHAKINFDGQEHPIEIKSRLVTGCPKDSSAYSSESLYLVCHYDVWSDVLENIHKELLPSIDNSDFSNIVDKRWMNVLIFEFQSFGRYPLMDEQGGITFSNLWLEDKSPQEIADEITHYINSVTAGFKREIEFLINKYQKDVATP